MLSWACLALPVRDELPPSKVFGSLDFARLVGATPQSPTMALLFFSESGKSGSRPFLGRRSTVVAQL